MQMCLDMLNSASKGDFVMCWPKIILYWLAEKKKTDMEEEEDSKSLFQLLG